MRQLTSQKMLNTDKSLPKGQCESLNEGGQEPACGAAPLSTYC